MSTENFFVWYLLTMKRRSIQSKLLLLNAIRQLGVAKRFAEFWKT